MLGNLLESRRRRHWSVEGIFASALAHGALIVAAGYAGGMVTPPPVDSDQPPDRIIFVPSPAAPAQSGPAHGSGARGRGSSAPVLLLPPERLGPISMPPITAPVPVDLGNFISGAGDFGGADGGREGGGGGVGVGSSGGSGGGAFYAERAAVPRPGNPKPEYPSLLRSAGVEGRVTARFIVDTAGRVEPGSIELETESNELFAAAVRKALERARFTAAETGGRKVRMRMWQEFAFRLTQ